MSKEFRVLRVVEDDAHVRAIFTNERLSDAKTQEALFLDLDELAQSGARSMILDLRCVKSLEATVPGRLVRLSNALKASGGTLTVLAAANICEVFRALQLDRIFRLAETDGADQTFRLP